MRLFRRHRPEPAAKPAAAPVVAPEPDAPARAVQVVTGPPPLRTPEPPAATAAAAARPAESPKPMRHWHLATAEMRVPASSATPRRTAPREHQSRWHQV
jgi:hypothetical protein